MRKSVRSLFIGCSLLFLGEAWQVRAGVAYSDPPGGWTYIYNGDQLMVADDASGFASLDGTWSHSNGSDQWDGSTIGGTFSTGSCFGVDNGPGGANLIPSIGFPGGPAWSILHRSVKSLKPVGRKMHAFGLLPWRSEKWTGTEEWLLRPAC